VTDWRIVAFACCYGVSGGVSKSRYPIVILKNLRVHAPTN
jgi:hypothetical protein